MHLKRRNKMTSRRRTAHRPWQWAAWLIVALATGSGWVGLAQSGRGNLAGSVKDSSGAVVPNASLALTEANTGATYNANSSAEGLFTFPELPPGNYTLTVTAPTFETYTQSGITVNVGSTSTINAALKIGAT